MGHATSETPPSPDGLEIRLAAADQLYSLGGPILISVRYLNHSRQPRSMREPARTWEVQLSICNQQNPAVDMPFGRLFFFQHDGLEARSIEEAEIITLAPGATYEFRYDIGERWPERFLPGLNTVYIKDLTDDERTVTSNELGLRLAYDQSTVPALLAIADNPDAGEDALQAVQHWIGELRPDFRLATGEIDQAGHEHNRHLIQQTRAWWAAKGDSPEIRARIEQINRRF